MKNNLVSRLKNGFYKTLLASASLGSLYCNKNPIEPVDEKPVITSSYLSPTSGMAPVSVTVRLTCSDDNSIRDYTLINGLERITTTSPIDTTFALNETREITLKCSDSKGQEAVYGPINVDVTQPPTEQIAFWNDFGGNEDIYVGDLIEENLSNFKRLTTDPGQDLEPAWSPDGKYLSFTTNRNAQVTITIMDSNGNNQKQITPQSYLSKGSTWSPNGEQIAFTYIDFNTNTRGVAKINSDGTGLVKLIEKPANGTISSLVSWSKEGQIFYDMYENNNWDIYSVKPDGADETKLTNTPYNENLPSVSPTENRIAYVSDKFGSLDIHTMKFNGSDIRRITTNPGVEVDPRFSNDGKKIIFAFDAPLLYNPQLYLVNSDGTGDWVKLTIGDSKRYPAWRPKQP